MENLAEHTTTLVSIMGIIFTLLVGCVGYIVHSFRQEMQEDRNAREKMSERFEKKVDSIEAILTKLTDELFDRVRKAEHELSALWAEHNVIKSMKHGVCSNHKEE